MPVGLPGCERRRAGRGRASPEVAADDAIISIRGVTKSFGRHTVLRRSRLVAFGSKADMTATGEPIVRQFLAGRAEGPIGMDEMAESDRTAPADPAALGAVAAAAAS